MRKPVFYVSAARNDPEGSSAISLNLPAMPYEMLDALDQLRVGTGDSAKVRIDKYYRFAPLAAFLCGQKDLFTLNALAQKLSELDDQQAAVFEGLLAIELKTRTAPTHLPALINMAYSTQGCLMIGEALNDSQLGYICAQNGLVPEVSDLPEHIFELLDFERIGREHRRANRGVFVERTADHPGGYVKRPRELTEAYKTLDLVPKTPDYTILLEVSKGFFDDIQYDSDKSTLLKLPASPAELDAVLDCLDIWDWREAAWYCFDCRVPALADAVSDSDDINFINRLAQDLAAMGPARLTAYKALVEATHCQDLLSAGFLAEQLDNYTFSPESRSPAQAAGQTCPLKGQPKRENYRQELGQPGRALIEGPGAVLTTYGLIQRKDHQPVQAPQQKPPEGGMTLA